MRARIASILVCALVATMIVSAQAGATLTKAPSELCPPESTMAEGFIPDTEPGVQGFGICVRDAREVLVNPTFTVTVDAPFDVLSTEPASAVVERPTPTTARISIPKLSVGGTESMAVRLRLVAPDATGDRRLSITGAADLIYDGIPAGTLPLDFEEVTLHFAPAASAPGPAAPAPRAAAKAADVQAVAHTSHQAILAGDPVAARLDVSNVGTGPARDATAAITLPTGTALYSVSAPRGTCTILGKRILCSFDTLEPGAVVPIYLRYDLARKGKATLTVTAATSSQDARLPNNADSVTTTVAGYNYCMTTWNGAVKGDGSLWDDTQQLEVACQRLDARGLAALAWKMAKNAAPQAAICGARAQLTKFAQDQVLRKLLVGRAVALTPLTKKLPSVAGHTFWNAVAFGGGTSDRCDAVRRYLGAAEKLAARAIRASHSKMLTFVRTTSVKIDQQWVPYIRDDVTEVTTSICTKKGTQTVLRLRFVHVVR